MNAQAIISVVRLLLSAFGGTLTVSDSEIAAVVGAVVTIGTVVWSLYEKHQAAKKSE